MNTNPPRRRVAKCLLWLSEKLNFIQTPTRTYRWNESVDEPDFEPAGWARLPALSIWLMDRSYDLDPQHWDHWATECEDDCQAPICVECDAHFHH